jgi:uncharacterized protein YcfL
MKKLGIVITAVAAALLTGCAQNCATISSFSNHGAVVGPGKLTRNINVSTSSARLAGDMVVGKVAMTNLTNDQQQVKYQFEWFDNTGTPVGENTPWQPLSLEPNISRVVSATAPTPEATNFNILVCQ